MTVEARVMGLGVSHSSSPEEQKKALAELREYCTQHPEEARAFANANRIKPEDLLEAFQKGWAFFEKVKSVFTLFSGRDREPPPADAPPPSA